MFPRRCARNRATRARYLLVPDTVFGSNGVPCDYHAARTRPISSCFRATVTVHLVVGPRRDHVSTLCRPAHTCGARAHTHTWTVDWNSPREARPRLSLLAGSAKREGNNSWHVILVTVVPIRGTRRLGIPRSSSSARIREIPIRTIRSRTGRGGVETSANFCPA